jgi:hypothetical protein
MKNEELVQVQIRSDLYRDLQNALNGSGFATVDEYVNYVLRVAIGKKPKGSTAEVQEMSKEESELVFDKLKALGYV